MLLCIILPQTWMRMHPAMQHNVCAALSGLDVVVLEASDGVGGRVRTDEVAGFLLDRGFQIFLTGYPTAQQELNYDALQLQPFYAGALVQFDGAWHRCAHAVCSFCFVALGCCPAWASSGSGLCLTLCQRCLMLVAL